MRQASTSSWWSLRITGEIYDTNNNEISCLIYLIMITVIIEITVKMTVMLYE